MDETPSLSDEIDPKAQFSIIPDKDGTFKILQNGKEHPALVGFYSRTHAWLILKSLIRQQQHAEGVTVSVAKKGKIVSKQRRGSSNEQDT